MRIVRVLENKTVIQFFGTSLMLAPFVNIFASVLLAKSAHHSWSLSLFQSVISTSGTFVLILYVASLLCGLLMLIQSQKAWSFVLVLLSLYVSKQIMTLGADFKRHWVAGAFFAINLLVLLFIADQLVFKQKKPGKSDKPTNTKSNLAGKSLEITSSEDSEKTKTQLNPQKRRKKIYLRTSTGEKWAQLISISDQEVHLKKVADSFSFREPKKIEMVIGKNLKLSASMFKTNERNVYFSFDNLTIDGRQKLRMWLNQRIAKSAS